MNFTKKYPFEHSFARYILNKKNLSLSMANQKVLPLIDDEQVEKHFSKYLKLINPNYIIGNIKRPEKFIVITNMDELRNNYGYVVKSSLTRESNIKLFNKTKVYSLAKYRQGDVNYLSSIPNNCVIYDVDKDTLYIQGPNSDNIAVKRNEKVTYQKKDALGFPISDYNFVPEVELQHIKKKLNIRETDIIVGISTEGAVIELVCIPKLPDEPTIGIFGGTGTGKSMFQHSLVDQMYWRFINVCEMNDWDDEYLSWGLPNNVAVHIKYLNSLGLEPKPLPTVYIVPNTSENNRLKYYFTKDEQINIYQTLKWKEFIKKYDKISKNYSEMSLGGTGRYLDYNKLSEVKSMEELNEFIETTFPNAKAKNEINMKSKIKNVFGLFFQKELLDIKSGIPSEITITDSVSGASRVMPLFCGLMYSNLVPIYRTRCLNSIGIGKEGILSIYLNFLIDEFYDFKYSSDELKNKRTHIFIDELHTLISKGDVRQAINDIVTLGRHGNIGWTIIQQSYSDIEDWKEIKNNIKYLFCFQINSENEAKLICKDMGRSELAKSLLTLSRKYKNTPLFECMVFPKQPLAIYNLQTGERREAIEVKRITTIPPMSLHKSPGMIM